MKETELIRLEENNKNRAHRINYKSLGGPIEHIKTNPHHTKNPNKILETTAIVLISRYPTNNPSKHYLSYIN